MQTRRAVTLALAAVPFATAATGSTIVEPVFAAIEAHRAACELVRAMGNTDYDEDAFDALNSAVSDRLAELLATTPTTLAGCVAMLRYVETEATEADEATASQLFRDWYEPVSEPAATLLGRLADVIERAASR